LGGGQAEGPGRLDREAYSGGGNTHAQNVPKRGALIP
jgi:hypothetical protein